MLRPKYFEFLFVSLYLSFSAPLNFFGLLLFTELSLVFCFVVICARFLCMGGSSCCAFHDLFWWPRSFGKQKKCCHWDLGIFFLRLFFFQDYSFLSGPSQKAPFEFCAFFSFLCRNFLFFKLFFLRYRCNRNVWPESRSPNSTWRTHHNTFFQEKVALFWNKLGLGDDLAFNIVWPSAGNKHGSDLICFHLFSLSPKHAPVLLAHIKEVTNFVINFVSSKDELILFGCKNLCFAWWAQRKEICVKKNHPNKGKKIGGGSTTMDTERRQPSSRGRIFWPVPRCLQGDPTRCRQEGGVRWHPCNRILMPV